MDRVENFLQHYGVKGMKWGVRRSDAALARAAIKRGDEIPVKATQKPGQRVKAVGGHNRKASDDAVAAAMARQKARASTTDALSTKELQQLVTRMNLEQQYARLSTPQKSAGKKFVERMFRDPNYRDQNMKNARNLPVVKQVGDVMSVRKAISRTDLTKIY